ncbi:hypothetical protein G9A89_013586 [Geosiphon pyriformis]|nr:hypothetical protein G9A89_013586 [Geosiphon pyriformis]
MSEVYLKKQEYGKDRVRLMKVIRCGDWHEIIELTVRILLGGDFTVSYTEGDNTPIVATDSMKNIIYYLAKKSSNVQHIELFAMEIGEFFVTKYTHVSHANVLITRHRWTRMLIDGKLHQHSFIRDGEETRNTHVIVAKEKNLRISVKIESGLKDILVLKTTGSAFRSFLRDEFTTLPETDDRILSTAVDATWTFKIPDLTFVRAIPFDDIYNSIRQITLNTFAIENSVSVQATLYLMAKRALENHQELENISYSLPNRHCFAIDLSHFGLKNTGKEAEIFVPFSDPSGLITATVARSKLMVKNEITPHGISTDNPKFPLVKAHFFGMKFDNALLPPTPIDKTLNVIGIGFGVRIDLGTMLLANTVDAACTGIRVCVFTKHK